MENLPPRLVKKLKQIRLVATDLDGTLLNNQGQISSVTLEAVQKLQGLGVRIAIMTGRAHSSAERIADELGVEAPIISLDGGLVRLPHSRTNIFASYVRPKVTRKIIAEAGTKFATVALFVDDKMIRRESETMLPSYIENLDLDTIEADDLSPFADRAIQIIIGADSKQTVRSIARGAAGLFSGVDVKIYRSSHHDERWYIEIRNKSHSKATGLAQLEKYFRISKNEVVVLGDFENDVKAFDRAGTGVAMKNAVWELKERADWVTDSTNDENGAAEFFGLIYRIRTDSKN